MIYTQPIIAICLVIGLGLMAWLVPKLSLKNNKQVTGVVFVIIGGVAVTIALGHLWLLGRLF